MNAFIACHVAGLAAWLMPASWPLRAPLVAVITPYVRFVGLWQSWGMFAPEPLAFNIHVEADVAFRDGSVRRWKPPRMGELDLLTRYQKERWRRWSEVIRLERNRAAWPDAARFIARLHADPANPPVAVTLHRRWAAVPPIAVGLARRTVQPRYDHAAIYTYRLAPRDLP